MVQCRRWLPGAAGAFCPLLLFPPFPDHLPLEIKSGGGLSGSLLG